MQPETAFWLLAATAQAAAALAGLSALVLVFGVRVAAQGWQDLERERNPTYRAMRAKAWLDVMQYSGMAAFAFLLAVGLSLGTLSLVSPGVGAVPLAVDLLAFAALSTTVAGGAMLALAVATPWAFFVPALAHIAKGMTRRRLRAELRRIHAKDRERAEAAWGSPER